MNLRQMPDLRRRVARALFIGGLLGLMAQGADAQSNSYLTFMSLRSALPQHARFWSMELSQFLLLPQADEIRELKLKADSEGKNQRNSSIASAVTNAALVLQEPLSQLEEARMDIIVRRIDEGGFGVSTGTKTRNVLDRGIENVFSPEPIRLGRAEIGFSPYTAIKRRNPLCLINPIPLGVSW